MNTIALAGNPNVGKSTVFNALTGMKQHTGNWPGKTVENAEGITNFRKKEYKIYDLPGTYSLIAHSEEEEIARDFICFKEYDAVVVVCDAVCLERNLNLALQVLEVTNKVVICVNLMDEAIKKGIIIDLDRLERLLEVPVVGTSARSKKGLNELMDAVAQVCQSKSDKNFPIEYGKDIESSRRRIAREINDLPKNINKDWLSLKLLDYDQSLVKSLNDSIDFTISDSLQTIIMEERIKLEENGIDVLKLKEKTVGKTVRIAEFLAKQVVQFTNTDYQKKDRKIDKILTNKWTGFPIMILLLMAIFWITIEGANYPSGKLFEFFTWLEQYISNFVNFFSPPSWLHDLLIEGVYRVVTWVTAVMLPPMAIFFPLFTLLEDLGVLPRIAFNLDHGFKKCNACGKQSLTMCMGFGCNAAGVTGTRIIDSPRERLIAILTNNFVPCNGRFPTLIAIITMFFAGTGNGLSSLIKVSILTVIILFGILMTFIVSKLLSKYVLKGIPSSFTLELPPYRRPQIGKVIIRSIFDRTLFVLGRALVVAIPAGLLIWVLANTYIGDTSLLISLSTFFDPFAKWIGLDGAIVVAFLLGFPANEIVMPIMLMIYLKTGTLIDFDNLNDLKLLLLDQGWTWITALSTMIICLLHFPCSTTCLTIKKETGSWKWTLVSILIPTVIGIAICAILANVLPLFGV